VSITAQQPKGGFQRRKSGQQPKPLQFLRVPHPHMNAPCIEVVSHARRPNGTRSLVAKEKEQVPRRREVLQADGKADHHEQEQRQESVLAAHLEPGRLSGGKGVGGHRQRVKARRMGVRLWSGKHLRRGVDANQRDGSPCPRRLRPALRRPVAIALERGSRHATECLKAIPRSRRAFQPYKQIPRIEALTTHSGSTASG